MRTWTWLAVAIAAMGCAERVANRPAPTCREALAHFYVVGCEYRDIESGAPFSLGQITNDCEAYVAELSTRCPREVPDWISCMGETTRADGCDCSPEQNALIECAKVRN